MQFNCMQCNGKVWKQVVENRNGNRTCTKSLVEADAQPPHCAIHHSHANDKSACNFRALFLFSNSFSLCFFFSSLSLSLLFHRPLIVLKESSRTTCASQLTKPKPELAKLNLSLSLYLNLCFLFFSLFSFFVNLDV